MTTDRDPELQALFAAANRDLEEEAFTARVMARLHARQRWTVAAWLVAGLTAAACVALLAWPLQDIAGAAAPFLFSTLIDIGSPLLAQTLAPLNSVAGVLALGLIGLRAAYRKILL